MRIRPTRLAAVTLLTVLATTVASSATPASGRTAFLIDQVSRAQGGSAASAAIPALVYELHIKEPTFEADATYVVDRQGRMRIDAYANGKRFVTECYDGRHGWGMDGEGVVGTE